MSTIYMSKAIDIELELDEVLDEADNSDIIDYVLGDSGCEQQLNDHYREELMADDDFLREVREANDWLTEEEADDKFNSPPRDLQVGETYIAREGGGTIARYVEVNDGQWAVNLLGKGWFIAPKATALHLLKYYEEPV